MVTITEPHPHRARRHTLHQGGSQKLLSFFSLSKHVVCFFLFSVPLLSFTSLFTSFSSPSLSPLSPLLFTSSSVAGGENPGDTYTQTHSSGRCFENALRRSWVQSLYTHTHLHPHKHKHSRAPRQSLHPHAATHTHKHAAGLSAAGWGLWRCVSPRYSRGVLRNL